MHASAQTFAATDEAWQERLAALHPAEYARTRNHLRGSVSYLSPYLTHGYLSLQDAVDGVRARHTLRPDEKLFSEFAWRVFFHHVYSHLGDGIFEDIRPGVPGIRYAATLPQDIREGRTGLPVIDQAVGALYTTGYLHNHARMWLASYVVHLRHVHWRAGADWMYGHLLDGDLASNHLSWQWVASTFSSKPYLFNADNVAKYAPSAWHCAGTPLDTSYEHLDQMARGEDEPGRRRFESMAQHAERHAFAQAEPSLTARCPAHVPLKKGDFSAALASLQPGSGVELVHPWALSSRSQPNVLRIGLPHLPEQLRHPWSERRWRFVAERMRTVCDVVWDTSLEELLAELPSGVSLFSIDSLQCTKTRHSLHQAGVQWGRAASLLTEPDRLCRSFSQFIRAVKPTAPGSLNPAIR
ncbi:MAG: hypothetical protein RLY30_260 [Pseudomonadota bacterium]|jgi:deoxyribodipyrimidine photo-lyase